MLTINLCKKKIRWLINHFIQIRVQHKFPEKRIVQKASIHHNNAIHFPQGLTGPPGLQGPVGPPGDPGERVSQQTNYPGYSW